MPKPIGVVTVEGERVSIYNPGVTPAEVPHVVLEERIEEVQLDARRRGILNKVDGFLHVVVKKETRNGKPSFTVR